jgi:hypothetical protein
VDQDEGHYMRKAKQVLHGSGPQETALSCERPFDHPYFGSAPLGMIGHPDIRPCWLKQKVPVETMT